MGLSMALSFVVWIFYCSIQLGMSSSQLTNSYFSEGQVNHQPVLELRFLSIGTCVLMDALFEWICYHHLWVGFNRQNMHGDQGDV